MNGIYGAEDLRDAFSIDLPEGTVSDPELLARFLFENQPRWIVSLMKFRDLIAAVFGLKTAKQLKALDRYQPKDRIHIFKIYESHNDEVILGENDEHLDFRLSISYRPDSGNAERPPRLIVSTVVQCHNCLGRIYIWLIAPFHRQVVRSVLRRAARIGWPQRDGPAR
ncbi:DUF2867 domain-containing protein [Hydrocarboniphaga sp.]|uniref:DUF2867 domain-containing protein n=1 Tax=Hydrocarboniphaga sp. TaxID=2033016 RepID=UPI0026327E65|nr:DUF2867 domain-containing protein [Hydrocarboniphaga sp.]